MKNILIIEDELLIAQSLKRLLERRGHHVMTTESGSRAIELIQIEKFDRIVCDLMLQDISGFDVMEESKRLFGLNFIAKHFIIMTAYSSEQVLEKAKLYGCSIIHKPFGNISDTMLQIEGP
jgi:CheY-like chemotaxis protein